MPYEMNSQEQEMWHWECRSDRAFKNNYIGLKYKWWYEGNDVVFDLKFIPNFKKLWNDYLKASD